MVARVFETVDPSVLRFCISYTHTDAGRPRMRQSGYMIWNRLIYFYTISLRVGLTGICMPLVRHTKGAGCLINKPYFGGRKPKYLHSGYEFAGRSQCSNISCPYPTYRAAFRVRVTN